MQAPQHQLRSPVVAVVFTACCWLHGPLTSPPAHGNDTKKPSRKPQLAQLPRSVAAPSDNPTTVAKAALGKQLFFDSRLSGDNKTSCADCHLPEHAFTDRRKTARGQQGQPLVRNTPTVVNTAFFKHLLWDGRATSLEQQALAPIVSPTEMNQDLDRLESELNAIPGYVVQFQRVFGSSITRQTIAKALAAFERTLISKPSPLDRFLAGDRSALSEEARRGLELFRGDAGCIRCHNGPLLSDGKFYRLGLSRKDKGRGAVTGRPRDAFRFRTPSLREISRTAPYMHDGSLKTLDSVVTFYYRGVSTTTPDGLPLDVKPLLGNSFSQISDIVAFLKSLSSEPLKVLPPKLPR